MEEINFSARFNEEFKNARRSIKKPNVFILGGTGAGKSSLVNMVFGKALATGGPRITCGPVPEDIPLGGRNCRNERIRALRARGDITGIGPMRQESTRP